MQLTQSFEICEKKSKFSSLQFLYPGNQPELPSNGLAGDYMLYWHISHLVSELHIKEDVVFLALFGDNFSQSPSE